MVTHLPAVLWCGALTLAGQSVYKDMPRVYRKVADSVAEFWAGSVDDVYRFLDGRVHKGSVSRDATTAGGRPMRTVVYGQRRGAESPRHRGGRQRLDWVRTFKSGLCGRTSEEFGRGLVGPAF